MKNQPTIPHRLMPYAAISTVFILLAWLPCMQGASVASGNFATPANGLYDFTDTPPNVDAFYRLRLP